MQRYLRRLLLAGVIAASTASVQATMIGGGHRMSGGAFHGDRFFDHHRFHHDRDFFFFFDFGFPVYYWPPYYAYGPGYYYYDYAYYPASYPYANSTYATPARTYLELGHDWAKDLRLDIVTWDQFVAYVRAYVVNAPPGARDDFRRGFVGAYGANGEAAYAKAIRDTQAAPTSQAPGNHGY